jgi:hypothetical protein
LSLNGEDREWRVISEKIPEAYHSYRIVRNDEAERC